MDDNVWENGGRSNFPIQSRTRRKVQALRIVEVSVVFAINRQGGLHVFSDIARELMRHDALRELGPDLLDASFDAAAAARRARNEDGRAIADVLLNQRVVAGIGNVFKSEILFVAGIYPFVPAADLLDADLIRILGIARDLLRANAADRPRLMPSRGRRTRDSLDPSAALWVYGRGGKPCRTCGTPIQAKKTGVDARLTYWCPSCQPIVGPA